MEHRMGKTLNMRWKVVSRECGLDNYYNILGL